MKWLSIVRFVPDPVRGEYINVAAIAGDDETEETEIKSVSNLSRAKKLDESHTLGSVMDFVGELQARAEDGLKRAEIETLSNEMRNIVQLSTPATVIAHSLGEAMRIAFEEFILDPTRESLEFATKARAKGSMRGAYNRGQINFHQDATVRSGPYATEFDFAVSNGSPVQLVKCWSFQVSNQTWLAEQIRAWVWGVRAIRQGKGAELIADAESAPVPQQVDVEAVFIPPRDGQMSSVAYDVAQEAFTDPDVSVKLVPSADATAVANRARLLLQHLPIPVAQN